MDRFTDEQIREYNDAFCFFDKRNNGFIVSNELREMLKTIGYNPTDKTLEELMIIIDNDNDGTITFREFIDLIDKLEDDDKQTLECKVCFIFHSDKRDFMSRPIIFI